MDSDLWSTNHQNRFEIWLFFHGRVFRGALKKDILDGGEKFVRAIEAALEELSKNPLNFRMVGEEIHFYRLRHFPIYLLYH